MRTLCLTLFVTTALILVSGILALAAPLPATAGGQGAASIAVVDLEVSPGLMRPDDARAVYHEDGRQLTMKWDSSDSRLSGAVTALCNRHINRDGSLVESEVYEVVNDGGRWTGLSTGIAAAPATSDLVIGSGLLPSGPGHEDMVLFHGEGSYEGFSALVDIDWAQQPPEVKATVLEGDLPPVPDLAAMG